MGIGGPLPAGAPRLDLQPQVRTEQRAIPGVVQTLGLLTMTHADLIEAAERALADSPVLERSDGHPCPGCGRHVTGGWCARCRRAGAERELQEETDAGTDPFRSLETEALLEARSDSRDVVPVIMAHLTPRGLLDATVGEISTGHGLDPARVAEALRAVRAVGPPGLAAPDVTTLLAEQAADLADRGRAPDWTADVVAQCLPELADDDAEGAAATLGLTVGQVEEAFGLIRTRLRPYVDVGHRTAGPRALPDVFVYRGDGGDYDVEVPTSAWFGLAVASFPGQVAASAEAREWLRDHEREAKRLLAQIDARGSVLLRVTTTALEHQKHFLADGALRHRPLTRSALAAELGLHPSTVSRAVKDKSLRLPDGRVEPLACLFGTSVAARAALETLVRDAGPGRTDAALREELGRQGFRVARRTVAKYRSTLA